MNSPETMPATTFTSFMVSYRYYTSGIPASDPLPIVDGLKTFQEASEYALAIHTPGYGWAHCTPEKWDLEAGTATITYDHTIHSTSFEITIRPSLKFNVSLCWYIDGLPATNPVCIRQGLKRFDDAVEDARQVRTMGDVWSQKGIEVWDEENGWGSIRYYHLEDDEFFEVLVSKD